jgi:hypothetical protein
MKINKVLAIAINNYENKVLDKIQNCHKDVLSIIEVLNEKYEIDDVEFISEKSETTRKSLYNKLNEYFINRLEDENVLLIYAGHGEYNEKLNTAYWQPSDSDPSDSSSWISLTEILSFINASKAFHIGIISDSCFSGAIFEPTKRGGGIDAFDSKKSRLGLTSGGLEKVSDGQKGKASPFAISLTKILKENTQEELPFSILGTNLIMEFSSEKNQTPMFGPLNNVGHEGGSFNFKLKKEKKKTIKINNQNNFLSERLGNLFIPISESDLLIIKEIEPITRLKTESVNAQKYEDAVRYRDKEKELEEKIKKKSSDYIDSFLSKMTYSATEIKKSKELDSQITEYKEHIEEEKITNVEEEETTKLHYSKYLKSFLHYLKPTDPEKALFSSERDIFLKAYKKNIIDIYEHIVRIKCLSKSEFLNSKIDELKEILMRIYEYEVRLLLKGYRNELDEIMTIKEIEIKVLNWIKNK